MPGNILVVPGDITQISVDAIAFSASSYLGRDGNLCSSFERNIPGFAEWYRATKKCLTPPVNVGRTFWMKLDADAKPAGLAVVVSTGGDTTVPDKAAVAVDSALRRIVAELRSLGRTGRLLIGLPAFRVGRGGDHYQRLESAMLQITAARHFLADHDDIDVAFLTYTGPLYRIFLEARQRVCGPAAFDADYAPLAEAFQDRSCVVFVGAGMSRDCGLPGWDELMLRLRADLNISATGWLDSLDLAQWYRDEFGNDRLAEMVKSTYSGKGRPSAAHYLLTGLPLRHVITTNYDRLLETALEALKLRPVPIVAERDVARTGEEGVFVVKLHGDAERAAEIVLSRDDYDTFFQQRPAMALLLESLLLNRTFFFVGYSLRDPNFRELFGRISRMLPDSRRPAFATTFEAGGDTARLVQRQWSRQKLSLIPIAGVTECERKRRLLLFLDALGERVTLNAPPLALAGDVPGSAALQPLLRLLEEAGHEVERLCREKMPERDARFLASIVDFLSAHGWRPIRSWTGSELGKVYELLAAGVSDPALKTRLLVSALATCEKYADVERLRAMVEKS